MASAPASAAPASAAPLFRTAEQAVAAAGAYAQSIAGGASQRDRDGAVPEAELAALDATGLLSITVPRDAGGAGLGAAALAEVVRVIAAADPAIAQPLQPHFLMVDVIAVWGTPELKRNLFAEILDGGRFGNAAAERGGQHAQDLKTRLHGFPAAPGAGNGNGAGAAPGSPAGVTLTGKKYYTTGSLTARWIGVTALDDQDRVGLAFVRRDSPGLVLDTDWNVMGQRATVSGSATFTGVAVDPRLIVDYTRAFEVPQQLGARTQLVHAAIQTGIAGGALLDAAWFVSEKARPFFEAVRGGWGQTASQDPHTIYQYGQLATKVRAAETLLASAAATLDEIGRVPASPEEAARGTIAVAQAKAFASEVATEVASGLFGLSGASAADEKYGLSRHWRNARTHASHDPVAWKYHHIGNYMLNDVLPPNHGQL
jgi:SfnB family sulfur acquisition oxidoreductase